MHKGEYIFLKMGGLCNVIEFDWFVLDQNFVIFLSNPTQLSKYKREIVSQSVPPYMLKSIKMFTENLFFLFSLDKTILS